MDPVAGVILGAAIAGLSSILVALIQRDTRKKVDETHRQLTTNHHISSPPTALDKLDSIQKGLSELHQRQDQQDLILMDVKEGLSKHIQWHLER